jgi:hypothetical protein
MGGVVVMRDGQAGASRPGSTAVDRDGGGDGAAGAVPSMVAAYRHDVHKLRGQTHAHAAKEFRGVPVNQDVPLSADAHAALLSRPRGKPAQTVPAHESPRRLPLLDGELDRVAGQVDDVADAVYDLVSIENAEALHEAWLDASVPALFSESRYYPFTSVKYHTLLAAALLDNYRAGHDFEDLYLAVSEHGPEDPVVVPHRTVLTTPWFALHVTGEPEHPAARIGDVPTRCFADVWARLPTVPFAVDEKRCWRVLDAQLRRIRSWSTALQYVEAFTAALYDDDGGSGSGSGSPVAGWSP